MRGLIFAAVLASAVLHASWNFLSKKASGDYRVLWLSLVLWTGCSLPAVGYLLYRDGFSSASVIPLVVSILAHASYFSTLMAAYRAGDISLAYPIARGIGVAGTGVLGILLLQEQVTPLGGGGIIFVVLGVLLIGKSGASKAGQRKAYLFALLTGAAIVTYSVADKYGVSSAHPFLYLGLLNLGSAVVTAPFALRQGTKGLRDCWRVHRLGILLIALGSGLTYLLILWVMRRERASYIVAVRESSVVVAVLLGRFFLREELTLYKISGILGILAGLVLIRLG